MESQLKRDVLREIQAGHGRVLLHDEVETKPGSYEIIPIWETVEDRDVMTPREMYDGAIEEKYQVDYARVAIVRNESKLTKVPLTGNRPTSKRHCQLLYRT